MIRATDVIRGSGPALVSGEGRIAPAVEDQVRDDCRRQRREQDAVAKVAGRVDQTVDAGRRSDDRQRVGRRRAQAGASVQKRRAPRLRQQFADRVEQVANAGRRGSLVEADLLNRRADEHRAVTPWDDVAVLPPDHMRQRAGLSTPAESAGREPGAPRARPESG